MRNCCSTSRTDKSGSQNRITIPQGFLPMSSISPKPRLGAGLNDSTLGLVALAILLVAAVLWSANSPNAERTDFALTYVGAHIVHSGTGNRLYDTGLQVQL